MVIQLTIELYTGLENNIYTEKMTHCKQLHEHIQFVESWLKSFFKKMILSTSFLFKKLVKTPNNKSANTGAFNNCSYFPKKDNSNV